MPKPNKNETKEGFISRFMISAEARRDYPTQSQRFAVAKSIWENYITKKIKL